jgi:hypothetical protein
MHSNDNQEISPEEYGTLIEGIKAEQQKPKNALNTFEQGFKNIHHTLVEKSVANLNE